MVKKEQTFKNWTIQIQDSGSVTVLKNGEVCNVVKAELKTIAKENNWPIEAEWTTQELGRFTVDVLEMIENKAVKFDGRTTVDKLKRYFKCVYNVSLRVYDGKNLADGSKKLSELRTDGAKSTGSLECRASITVGSLIQRVKEQFGLDIKIATQDDWDLVLDGITLATAGTIKKQATKADMEGLEGYQREGSGTKEESDVANVDVDMDATYCTINFSDLRLDEDKVIGLYKSGKGENIRKAVNNVIYDLNNEIYDGWGEEDVSIDLNERGAIYVDNLVQSDDNAYGFQFQFPCKFIVVAGGKVVDTFVVDEEPSEVEGYLFTNIPYDYELEEVEERLEEEDSEWIEDDMMGLINSTEKDKWIHSLEVGDLGDGLYVQDVDSYLYSVVIGGKVVLSFE